MNITIVPSALELSPTQSLVSSSQSRIPKIQAFIVPRVKSPNHIWCHDTKDLEQPSRDQYQEKYLWTWNAAIQCIWPH